MLRKILALLLALATGFTITCEKSLNDIHANFCKYQVNIKDSCRTPATSIRNSVYPSASTRGHINKQDYIIQRNFIRFVIRPNDVARYKSSVEQIISSSDDFFNSVKDTSALKNLAKSKPTFYLSNKLQDYSKEFTKQFGKERYVNYTKSVSGFASKYRHSWVSLQQPNVVKRYLIHELAHTLHYNSKTVQQQIKLLWKKVKNDLNTIKKCLKKNISKDYAFKNQMEFWAVMSELFFFRNTVAYNTKLTYQDMNQYFPQVSKLLNETYCYSTLKGTF